MLIVIFLSGDLSSNFFEICHGQCFICVAWPLGLCQVFETWATMSVLNCC